ncbi:MAG TPA: hypothetical protein VE396_05265 [Xanthobacteraceae bacterium]|jgi:hypothetical protein|nr:hypothetical protein [Xanthobacteraceae bacterium]
MKSLNVKLALSALAIAVLATPAFAQRSHQRVSNEQSQNAPALHYPDGAAGRTGTLESQESGVEFNLGR